MSGRFHVVIAGAGVAGLEAALALRALADELVSVELIAPEAVFTYRPLAVAEPFGAGEAARFPLPELVEAAGAVLRPGAVAAVDAERKTVELEGGGEVEYDALLLALGAQPRDAVPGALTFRGGEDVALLAALLERARGGELGRIVFAAPAAVAWPLPLYELGLMTAAHLSDRSASGVEIVVATPEDRPLGLFGANASEAVAELLELAGILVETNVVPLRFEDGVLQLAGGRAIEADQVVALPGLVGPRLEGVPCDGNGFVPTDGFGWVFTLTDVYAVGDMTEFPVKQGGIATQQADAAASAIAADAGAAVRPTTFRPILRGLLLTGRGSRFLRAEIAPQRSLVDVEPLWWPPAKIVGRHLAPFLAQHLGLPDDVPPPSHEGAVPVEVELDATGRPATSRV
jgi:sulfide:quinone oxidoreductase